MGAECRMHTSLEWTMDQGYECALKCVYARINATDWLTELVRQSSERVLKSHGESTIVFGNEWSGIV